LEILLQWIKVSSIIFCTIPFINLEPLESEYQSQALCSGCQKVCYGFSECYIPKCTSHLSISPTLCTNNSKGCTAFQAHYQKTLTIDIGQAVDWSANILCIEQYTDLVTPVAYSPDGICIVSASYIGFIRVWDAKTGEVVAGPFEGHISPVTSVAYSPDVTLLDPSYTATTQPLSSTPFIARPASDIVDTQDTAPFWFSRPIDGWVHGSQSELLFWVPPHHCGDFCQSKNIVLIGKNSMRLNLKHFVHGLKWHLCHTVRKTLKLNSLFFFIYFCPVEPEHDSKHSQTDCVNNISHACKYSIVYMPVCTCPHSIIKYSTISVT